MKHTLYICFLFLVSFSAISQEKDCSKFTPELSKQIKRELSFFETELIAKGYLKNNKAKSFVQFYKDNAGNFFQDLTRDERPLLKDYIYKLGISGCRLAIEDEAGKKAVREYQARFQSRMKAYTDTASTDDPSTLAKFIATLMLVSDLRKESVKRSYLISLIAQIRVEGTPKIFGDFTEPSINETFTPKHSLHISINEKDEIFINGESSDLKTLDKELLALIPKYKNDLEIEIGAKRETSYARYRGS